MQPPDPRSTQWRPWRLAMSEDKARFWVIQPPALLPFAPNHHSLCGARPERGRPTTCLLPTLSPVILTSTKASGPGEQGATLKAATIASPPGGRGSVTSQGLASRSLGSHKLNRIVRIGFFIRTRDRQLSSHGLGACQGRTPAHPRNHTALRDSACLVWRATAPLTAIPAEASGTFNPLHGVLCILRSLYLCSIGPRSVLLLAMDTHRTSNCSPKPLYSRMQPATPPVNPSTQIAQRRGR